MVEHYIEDVEKEVHHFLKNGDHLKPGLITSSVPMTLWCEKHQRPERVSRFEGNFETLQPGNCLKINIAVAENITSYFVRSYDVLTNAK